MLKLQHTEPSLCVFYLTARLQLGDVLAAHIAGGVAATQRQAVYTQRVVDAAVEIAGAVADCIQAGDRLAFGRETLVVLIDVDAGDNRRDAHVTVDAVERSGLDGHQVFGLLAKVLVGAFAAQLIVAFDGRTQGIGIDPEFLGQLFDSVGRPRVRASNCS